MVDIDRLVVDPSRHRRGLPRRRLAALPEGPVVVATGRDDAPAHALDAPLGDTHNRDDEVLPGLWASRYRRDG